MAIYNYFYILYNKGKEEIQYIVENKHSDTSLIRKGAARMCRYRNLHDGLYTEVSPKDVAVLERRNIVKREADGSYSFFGRYCQGRLQTTIHIEDNDLMDVVYKEDSEDGGIFSVSLYNDESEMLDDETVELRGIDALADAVKLVFS